jgi:glycosyltransferase involved in cell wall biosynthesis
MDQDFRTLNNLPLVTIAIPTYNRADSFLKEALRSAAAQTYSRLDILVADNASSDGTAALVRGFGRAPIRYLRHNNNIGSTANYNSCLKHARGEYFLLLHDDDAIDSDFIAACMESLHDHRDVALIRTGIRIIDASGKVLRQCANPVSGLSAAEFFCAWFEGRTYWYCANTLFNTAELRAAGGFHSPYNLAEDGFAIARLMTRGTRIDIPDVKASFRVHQGEQTFAAPRRAAQWGREYRALLDCMCAPLAPKDRARVRRAGLRFFAQRCYDRAAHARPGLDRARSHAQVFWLFGCRFLPWHRWPAWRWVRRVVLYAQRRVMTAMC